MWEFTEREFISAIALMIAAPAFGVQGSSMWLKGDDDKEAPSIVPPQDVSGFMKYYRFKEFQLFYPSVSEHPLKQTSNDPWWRFVTAVNEFNAHHGDVLGNSNEQTLDEIMCAWHPRTTALGELPNISFLKGKPEPLGSEFKVCSCCLTLQN